MYCRSAIFRSWFELSNRADHLLPAGWISDLLEIFCGPIQTLAQRMRHHGQIPQQQNLFSVAVPAPGNKHDGMATEKAPWDTGLVFIREHSLVKQSWIFVVPSSPNPGYFPAVLLIFSLNKRKHIIKCKAATLRRERIKGLSFSSISFVEMYLDNLQSS